MAYNFLSLVNDVLHEVNEVELTSGTFASASGVHSHVKTGVNSALRQINQDAFEWPFNHQTREVVLSVDQVSIPYQSATETINFGSVRIKGDNSLNVKGALLTQIDYEHYLSRYVDAEHNPSDYHDIPIYVFRRPNLSFGVYPPPNVAYTLEYDSYDIPTDLVAWDDVPYVPEQFRHLIKEGALPSAYMFRGDTEAAALYMSKFKDGIKQMRGIYQNRYEYVRSGFRNF